MRLRPSLRAALAALLIAPGGAANGSDAHETAALYQRHCAACHGADRLGGTGPALLPENLRRLRPKKAVAAITRGLPASQMPSFSGTLGEDEIARLAQYIYTPLPSVPVWDAAEIEASRVVKASTGDGARAHDADQEQAAQLDPVDIENDVIGFVYAPGRKADRIYNPFTRAHAYVR